MDYGQIKHSKIIELFALDQLTVCTNVEKYLHLLIIQALAKFIILIENVFYFRRIEDKR